MNKPDCYYSDDYAGLSFKGGSFYYGYEYTMCSVCGKTGNCDDHEDERQDWCFVAKFDGKEITIPFGKLGAKDMFDVSSCLNMGVGLILAKYQLTLA